MQSPNRKTNPPNTQDSPCLFAQCLYQANSKQEFFRLYSDELMKIYESENDTNALLEAGFVRNYASQISNPEFVRASKQVHGQLRKLVSELHPDLQANVEGRCKSTVSTINKGKKNIKHLEDIFDVYAFRVVIYGSFTEQELVSFCYKLLDKACKHFISHGYILCQSTRVSDTLDKNSEEYKNLVLPTESDLEQLSWLGPHHYKDYISTPKTNLYSSLHAAFASSKGFTFELQIRTWAMHVKAEEGDVTKGEQDTLSHRNYKAINYPDGVTYDPRQVNIPGYTVVVDPESGKLIIHDTIGLEVARPIVSGQ